MACIYKDELQAALSSSIFSSLEKDGEDANKLIEAINTYVGSAAGKVSGKVWTDSFNNFTLFVNVLGMRKNVSSSLGSSIKPPLQSLIAYMESYDVLDSGMLEELKQVVKECETAINNLKSQMNEKVKNEDTGENEYKLSATERSKLSSRIDNIQKNWDELKPLIVKLEGLDAVYNEALAQLTTAFEAITTFENEKENITPSREVKYSPAS